MQAVLSTVILPVVLAAIMLGMGLGLTIKDFERVFTQPKAACSGIVLQMLFLPALALLIIMLLPLSGAAAAGLFLVALCPGGATSNLFSFIARGNVALSVSLTAVISLVSPLTLPIAFLLFLNINGTEMAQFAVPVVPAIKQLALVSLVPVIVGMTLRRLAPEWAQAALPWVKRVSAMAMIVVIIALMATNLNVMKQMLTFNALAVLMLSSVSLLSAYRIAKWLNLDSATQRTIGLEVGVQNAGTAMMVALAILHQPELAVVPLMYGLLMNLPAFSFVAWVQQKPDYQVANS